MTRASEAVRTGTTVQAGQRAAHQPWLYATMIAAWAFDFQSAGQGQGVGIQGIFLGVFLGAFALFLVLERSSPIRIPWLTPMLAAGALYLTVGISAGLVNGQPIYPLLRNATSVLVYLTAIYATARTLAVSRPAVVRRLLAVLCLTFLVARPVIYSIVQGGIDPETVRFQIIGGSVVAATGYIALATLFRLRAVELATIVFNLGVLVFSVTRTFLVVLAAQAAVVLVEMRRLFNPRLLIGMTGALLALLTILALDSDQAERWGDRLGTTGRSGSVELQTWYTRTSEWEFMLRQWTASSGNLLIGSGFAAQTKYFLGSDYGARSESMTGFGHNQHISMLFNAGILGGLPLLIVMAINAWRAVRFLRKIAKHPDQRSDLAFLGAWGAMIVLGVLASDFLSASFAARGTALWYGIGTGLLLGVLACFDPGNAPSRRRPGTPQ